jgi:hypothetical protein
VHNHSKGDNDEPEVWTKSVNWFTYVGEELAKNDLAGWEQNANNLAKLSGGNGEVGATQQADKR